MSEAFAPPEPTKRGLAQTPFVGLVPYRERDAAFFFGRDREKEIVAGNLRAARLTVLYGASGVGKSSLLHAGVVHDLHEQAHATAAAPTARTPFAICAFSAWLDDPLYALAEAMRAACVEALGGEELPLWRRGEPLVDAVRAWTERVRPLLVVLDQFEDYFLYHAGEDGEGTFAAEFPRLVNEPNLHVNFVLSLREDAWAKLDRFEGRIPALFTNYIRVDHLHREAAREAIEGPVEEWNRRLARGGEPYQVEPALAATVIEAAAVGSLALGDGANGAPPQAASADGIEAPFLQLVLERLWRETVAAGAHTLDLIRLEALGGAQRIVENHLLEALGKLTRSEQAVAADVFKYLVTRSKTKIAHPAADLAAWTGRPEPTVTAVLEKLCRGESGRILRSISAAAADTTTSYELFHDVLAEPVLEWRRSYEQGLARRRFAKIGGMLVMLVAVFAALGIWALVQRSDANRATKAVTSLALATTADNQLANNFGVSLLLSLEAYKATTRPSAQAMSSMMSALETARTSGVEAILRAHQGAVKSVAFSPDGKTLAAAGYGGTVVLWDTATRTQLGQPLTADRHKGNVHGVAFSRDGKMLAAAGNDGTVALWNTQTRSRLGQPLNGHQSTVRGIAFSRDGKTLASGSGTDDGKRGAVVLWNTQTRHQVGHLLNSGHGTVWGVAFSPDGKTLAAADQDGTVVLWNTETGRHVGHPLNGHQKTVWGVAFSPDGKTLASAGTAAAGNDGTVVLWDTQTWRQLGPPVNCHPGTVNGVAFSGDGKTLAAACSDGTVVLWNMETRRPRGQPLNAQQGTVKGVAFSRDGKTLAAAGGDGTVVLWNAQNRSQLDQSLEGPPKHSVYGVAFSRDGKTLAAGTGTPDGKRGTVVLWNAQTGRQLGQPLNSQRGTVSSVAFSPDSKTLAAAGHDGTVVLWNTQTRSQVSQSLNGDQRTANGVSFNPNGKMLASAGTAAAGNDGTVVLWSTQTWSPLGRPLRGHPDPVMGVAFSPDGKTLASAGYDGTVALWKAQTRTQLGQPLNGHQGGVYGVAFSPDGKTLAAAGRDGTVALWNTQTRSELGQPLKGDQGTVYGVAFSPDGKTLASAGGDGTVALWNTQTHSQLGRPLKGDQGKVYGVAFSPDGKTLASAGADGTVVLWEPPFWNGFSNLKAMVCGLVFGGLTESEWQALVPAIHYRTTCSD